METIKELKNNYKLIAEFKNPNFLGKETNDIYPYYSAIKCALYGDNKGKYYLYKKINKIEIQEYNNYEMAVERYISFINIILQR